MYSSVTVKAHTSMCCRSMSNRLNVSNRVVTASIIILILSLLWAVIILVMKCIGPNKMGFLSGRFLAPAPFRPNDYLSVIRGDGDVNIDEIVSLHKTENDPTAPLVLSNVIEENDQIKKAHRKFSRRVKAVRATFLLSGLGVLVAGALYYGIAVKSFNSSFDEVRVGNDVSLNLFFDFTCT